ncbi:DUF4407 domain-containing protein [Flavobacterium arcticum]|uniref:DUF4407 domain-containing protein n=1 Tax=Flavobacterium arcticum TaxID=1784713 RepID=A0A345HA14_9FLAO|nr:DUF4407 domain-containing protein [Flavobacterium arcticum]AXG73424.1 DUF4407 domain-containing protein [Flavobacterium arcticum]KAF2513211.1 DUF4407 domain-containing protein [Flavobacterium arcticum]
MLKRFFITCSGADRAIIYSCSNGEQNKYAGIGATVFFTALLAWIASSYALFTVFDNIYIASFFGLIWGLLIFNLDRFIVSTIRKRDHFSQELLQATPRIILAIIIAIVISKPLEIKIFEKEIDTVLLKEKNDMALANKNQVADYFTSDISKNKTSIDSLKSEILKKEKEVNELYATYIAEAEGTSGTFKLGKGPVYNEKREKHDTALAQLNSLREKNTAKIEAKEAVAANLQIDLHKKIADSQPVIDNFDGLMARIKALDKLPLLPSLFIMLLFLAIETSPIIAKLLSPKGEYDFKLEENEMALKTSLAQNNYQRELMRTTDAGIYDDIYGEIRQDKELYNYKKKKAIELLEMQADSFSNKQKGVM